MKIWVWMNVDLFDLGLFAGLWWLFVEVGWERVHDCCRWDLGFVFKPFFSVYCIYVILLLVYVSNDITDVVLRCCWIFRVYSSYSFIVLVVCGNHQFSSTCERMVMNTPGLLWLEWGLVKRATMVHVCMYLPWLGHVSGVLALWLDLWSSSCGSFGLVGRSAQVIMCWKLGSLRPCLCFKSHLLRIALVLGY